MMSHLDLSGCKKRKRGETVFKFKTFGQRGYPAEFNGSFLQNVRELLEFGQVETHLSGAMTSWSFQLEVFRHPSLHVLLFVIEEPIELSFHHHCQHCQYIGWGHHMICNKKYHFLLPSKNTIPACLSHDNTNSMCKSNLIGLQGHTMHGVFHSNGFGHLLCINGLETGSDLAGYQIMEFWDRLCAGLGARKVSFKDTSQKKGMDLRLLHAVAYGKPWFGRWDYVFGRGSFGINLDMYESAVKALQNVPLCLLAHHLDARKNDILILLSRYQILSGHSLITLGDLFNFMLELTLEVPKDSSTTYSSQYPGLILSDTSCRWSPKRVEMAIRVVIQALKRAELRWVSRQEVRDAARAYIGDTGLLDFVLKSLGNHIVGKYFVRRCLNPVTKVLEYCLEDISNEFPKQEEFLMVTNEAKLKPHQKVTWVQLMKDIISLYKNVLVEQKEMTSAEGLGTISVASRIILDTKYFFKEYGGEFGSKSVVNKSKLYCAVVWSTCDGGALSLVKVATPYECFILENNATFDELKVEVQKTFREIYLGLRNFIAESVTGFNLKGTDLVFEMVRPGGKITFEGIEGQREIVNSGIYEGLTSNFVVDCGCGTKYDDGERMVCCDICDVWQHTRCVQIPNSEEIPNIFLCKTCEQDILHFPSIP
ncbi:PHD finger protein MALE STERILITY 1 isoform X1 [Olea europaea var. sylvestris]|uniref:PHD finger protein MALE STERILITY 1 isoform X1 n=1 Tax=Olea europaea var. sylvestris TaxID=158386 RepID=UPI000C1D4B6E|nr:PHD finger protein MALE STERILITY 1 isoform X1 [Olea europaea var. sylvestris]